MDAVKYIDILAHPERDGSWRKDEADTVSIWGYDLLGRLPETFPPYYSIGAHPWKTLDYKDSYPSKTIEEVLSSNHRPWAWGEIGLDFSRDIDRKLQMGLFIRQLALAEESKFSKILIHCVKAYHELIPLIKSQIFKGTYIIHHYNGSIQETKELLKYDVIFGYGRSIDQPTSKGQKSLDIIPIERLACETDGVKDRSIKDFYQSYSERLGVPSSWPNFTKYINYLVIN